ncbi:hypothetical protein [Sphingobacterium kitahiroshimense]|uniref:Uncharacterized protein n=1 Tax=Sphingobacterium kitahiroshimense TaxID=470446 RepID=A0ABV0C1J9_9SPHI
MNKNVPHKIDYDTTSLISTIQFWLVIVGSVSSFVTIFDIDEFIKSIIEISICIVSIIYFISEILYNNFFIKAEQHRIDDLIDNSLNSKIADENSENYYTNDNVKQSVVKLGVNGFENTFFTKNIVNEMIKKQFPVFFIILISYLISIFFVDKKVLVIVFQLILPLYIIKDSIQLFLFKTRVERIYDCYKKVFSSTRKTEREPIIINNIISYEKLISSYNIQLDSKIFNKMNPKLTNDWNNLKTKFGI